MITIKQCQCLLEKSAYIALINDFTEIQLRSSYINSLPISKNFTYVGQHSFCTYHPIIIYVIHKSKSIIANYQFPCILLYFLHRTFSIHVKKVSLTLSQTSYSKKDHTIPSLSHHQYMWMHSFKEHFHLHDHMGLLQLQKSKMPKLQVQWQTNKAINVQSWRQTTRRADSELICST